MIRVGLTRADACPGDGSRVGGQMRQASVSVSRAGLLTLHGAVRRGWFLCMWGDRAREGHSVDALAPGGDEGRGTLRKAMGSREQALIRGYPNGATHPAMGIVV